MKEFDRMAMGIIGVEYNQIVDTKGTTGEKGCKQEQGEHG